MSQPTSCSRHLLYKSTCIRHSLTSILVVAYLPFRLYIIIYIYIDIYHNIIYHVCVILACSLVIFLFFCIIPCSNLLFVTCCICTYALSHGNISIYRMVASTMKFTLFLVYPRNILCFLCLRSAYYRSTSFIITTIMLFIIFICI